MNEPDLADIVAMLPKGWGALQVARYDDLNGIKHVVYDVLDGDGHNVITNDNEVLTIDVEYPAGMVKWPVGSSFRLG